MLRMGLGLAAVLMPVQLLFGHLCGDYVDRYQPSKMAAIEGRWNDEKPAREVLFAWPDVENKRNRFAITLPPPFGSLIDSDSLTAAETGLNSISSEGLAAGGHPVLRVPHHGGMRPADAGARLGRQLSELQAPSGV